MVAHPRQRLGDSGLRAEHYRLGRHQTAGGVGVIGQQPPHGLGFLGVHRSEQLGAAHRRELAEQVGGVVGLHFIQCAGRLVEVEVLDDPDLLVLG